MNENNIKALFPEGIETITISKNDYDRLFGQLTYENIVLQSKIDKANEYLESHFIFDDENGEYYQTHTFDKCNAKELHDILKEDK